MRLLAFERSSLIFAFIVVPILDSWVPGHLSRVASTIHKRTNKNNAKMQCSDRGTYPEAEIIGNILIEVIKRTVNGIQLVFVQGRSKVGVLLPCPCYSHADCSPAVCHEGRLLWANVSQTQLLRWNSGHRPRPTYLPTHHYPDRSQPDKNTH